MSGQLTLRKVAVEARRRTKRARKDARRARRASKPTADVILTPEGMPAPAPTPGQATVI